MNVSRRRPASAEEFISIYMLLYKEKKIAIALCVNKNMCCLIACVSYIIIVLNMHRSQESGQTDYYYTRYILPHASVGARLSSGLSL